LENALELTGMIELAGKITESFENHEFKAGRKRVVGNTMALNLLPLAKSPTLT
jgi:hypothetical protein